MDQSFRMHLNAGQLSISDLNLRSSHFLKLPNELLLQIIRDTEPDDFWNLASSCQHMWMLSREFVLQHKQKQRSHRHYPYFRTPWEQHSHPLTRSNPSAPVRPDYSVVWDVYELLTCFPSAAKFVKSVALMREFRLLHDTSITHLNRIATSPIIHKFVSESTTLQQADLVGAVLDGLQIPDPRIYPNHRCWAFGWLVLLMLCCNIECLTTPRFGARDILKLMSTIAVSVYHEKFSSLGGNSYGLWSNLREIYIGPYQSKLPFQGMVLDYAELRQVARAERGIYIPIELVLPLLHLPSLKKLCVWYLCSAETPQDFEEAKRKTELVRSNVEHIEVCYGDVATDQLEAFFRPLKKLRRLIWAHQARENPNPNPAPFSFSGMNNALCNVRSALEALSLTLPGYTPIHSPYDGVSSLNGFTALKQLSIDVSLLFPAQPGAVGSQGARAPPLKLVDMIPTSLVTLSIFRSRRHIKEFEWEMFFAGLAHAKRRGRFPSFDLVRFYGNYSENNTLYSERTFDRRSESDYNHSFPTIGGIVERIVSAGITCTVYT
jgi:hypothetical protein